MENSYRILTRTVSVTFFRNKTISSCKTQFPQISCCMSPCSAATSLYVEYVQWLRPSLSRLDTLLRSQEQRSSRSSLFIFNSMGSPCDITFALCANCGKRGFCILMRFGDTIVNSTDRESVSLFKVSTLCRSRLIPSNLGQRSPCISHAAKEVKVYHTSHSFFRSVCTSMSPMFLFLCSARKGWFGQIVFRVLFSWIMGFGPTTVTRQTVLTPCV